MNAVAVRITQAVEVIHVRTTGRGKVIEVDGVPRAAAVIEGLNRTWTLYGAKNDGRGLRDLGSFPDSEEAIDYWTDLYSAGRIDEN